MAWLRVRRDEFNPEILEAYGAFTRAQKVDSDLTELQRQMIAVVVSSLSYCRF